MWMDVFKRGKGLKDDLLLKNPLRSSRKGRKNQVSSILFQSWVYLSNIDLNCLKFIFV